MLCLLISLLCFSLCNLYVKPNVGKGTTHILNPEFYCLVQVLFLKLCFVILYQLVFRAKFLGDNRDSGLALSTCHDPTWHKAVATTMETIHPPAVTVA